MLTSKLSVYDTTHFCLTQRSVAELRWGHTGALMPKLCPNSTGVSSNFIDNAHVELKVNKTKTKCCNGMSPGHCDMLPITLLASSLSVPRRPMQLQELADNTLTQKCTTTTGEIFQLDISSIRPRILDLPSQCSHYCF